MRCAGEMQSQRRAPAAIATSGGRCCDRGVAYPARSEDRWPHREKGPSITAAGSTAARPTRTSVVAQYRQADGNRYVRIQSKSNGESVPDSTARRSSDRPCGCSGHDARDGQDHSAGIEWGDSAQDFGSGCHGDVSGWQYSLQYDARADLLWVWLS